MVRQRASSRGATDNGSFVSKYQRKQRSRGNFNFVERNEETTDLLQAMIARSEDYRLPGTVRSGVRHDMLDLAMQTNDEEIWKLLGDAFVRAAEADDLVPRLSDRFVDNCPDIVFETFHRYCAATRFTGWKNRAIRIWQNR